MIDIILLIFLSRQIGEMATRRNLPPGRWKLKMIVYWLLCEIAGVFLFVFLYGLPKDGLLQMMLFSLTCAFGGYLWVRKQLEQMPESTDYF